MLETLLGATDADSLMGEVATVRVALMRLLRRLGQSGEPATGDLVRLMPLVLECARTVASLLRDRQVLQGHAEIPGRW